MHEKPSTLKSSERSEPVATRTQIREAFARLRLEYFRDSLGSFSHETAQKMARLEAAIALERELFWGGHDPMDELVSEAQRLGFYDPPKAA